MFELLFLLLPIAAAYGYYMGRNSYRHSKAIDKTEQTNNYLRGVDYLLNNETEDAMDNFIAYLDSIDPTFESTLALGNLFRQRGEVDRAISLHSSLAVSPNIDAVESQLAQIELANDFISAGLLDRAETILLDLVEIPNQRKKVVKLLIKLYEQERDFEKAIECGENYKDALDNIMLNQLCHYCCELAQRSIIASNLKSAKSYIDEALYWNKNSLRAHILLAEFTIKEQKENYQKEILSLVDKICALDSSSGIFCLDLLQKTFEDKKDPRYKLALEKLALKTKSASVIIELSKVIDEVEESEFAQELLNTQMKECPNLRIFSQIMAFRSKNNEQANSKNVIMQLKSMVDSQLAASPQYHCSKCGFESNMMFWQCPSCRRYDTIRVKHTLDGD